MHFREEKGKKKVGRRERLCIDNYDLEKEMMMTINQKVWCSEQKLTLLLLPSKANHKETNNLMKLENSTKWKMQSNFVFCSKTAARVAVEFSELKWIMGKSKIFLHAKMIQLCDKKQSFKTGLNLNGKTTKNSKSSFEFSSLNCTKQN